MEWIVIGVLGVGIYLWARVASATPLPHMAPSPPVPGLPARPAPPVPLVTPRAALPAGDVAPFVKTAQGVELSPQARQMLGPILASRFSVTGAGVVPGLFSLANTGAPSVNPSVPDLLRIAPTLTAWVQANVFDVIGAGPGTGEEVLLQLTQPGVAPASTLVEQLAGVFPPATSVEEAEGNKNTMVLLGNLE